MTTSSAASSGRRRLVRAVARLAGGPLAAALVRALRLSGRRRGLALVYHAIAAAPGDPACELVPAHGGAVVAAQLAHVRRIYRLVPASALPAAVAGRRRGQRFPLAITFDDDLASHAAVAAPLLRAAGAPATFFLCGASLDGPHAFWWERLQRAFDLGLDVGEAVPGGGGTLRAVALRIEALPPGERDAVGERLAGLVGPDPDGAGMRAVDVRALARDGFEIGFHTRLHHALPTLDDAELAAALSGGRERVAAAAGGDPGTISYPHGKADERVAAAARAVGYTTGFTGTPRAVRFGEDPLLCGRVQPAHSSAGALALQLARALLAP